MSLKSVYLPVQVFQTESFTQLNWEFYICRRWYDELQYVLDAINYKQNRT